MIILSILFFITAILYSSVGFGGGSTYLALLLIWDIPFYEFHPRGIIFLYKKNENEYFLLSPKKENHEGVIKKPVSFYETLKNSFEEENESSDENESLLLMDTDNPYTGKKKFGIYLNILNNF